MSATPGRKEHGTNWFKELGQHFPLDRFAYALRPIFKRLGWTEKPVTTPRTPAPLEKTSMPQTEAQTEQERQITPEELARLRAIARRKRALKLTVGGVLLAAATVACAAYGPEIVSTLVPGLTATPDNATSTPGSDTATATIEGIPADQFEAMLIDPSRWDQLLGSKELADVLRSKVESNPLYPTCENPELITVWNTDPNKVNAVGVCVGTSEAGTVPVVFGTVVDGHMVELSGKVIVEHEDDPSTGAAPRLPGALSSDVNVRLVVEGSEATVFIAQRRANVWSVNLPASSTEAQMGSVSVAASDTEMNGYLNNLVKLAEAPQVVPSENGGLPYRPVEAFLEQSQEQCILDITTLQAIAARTGVSIIECGPSHVPDAARESSLSKIGLLPEGAKYFIKIMQDFQLLTGASNVELHWNGGIGDASRYTVLATTGDRVFLMYAKIGEQTAESADPYSYWSTIVGGNPDSISYEAVDLPPGQSVNSLSIRWEKGTNDSRQIVSQGAELGQPRFVRDATKLDANGHGAWVENPLYLDPSMIPAGLALNNLAIVNNGDGALELRDFSKTPANIVMRNRYTVGADGNVTGTWEVVDHGTSGGSLEWDRNTKLPDLNTQNTKVETDKDGNTVLIFTINNQEYNYVVNKPQTVDRAGNAVEDGVVDVTLFDPPQSGVQNPLKIVFNQGQEPMAWFNKETGTWLNRYETLFTRSEYQDVSVGIVQDGIGFESVDKKDDSDEVLDYFVNFSGRPLRVYTEKVWNAEKKHYSTLYWTSVSYDEAGHYADVLVETDERGFLGNPGIEQRILITQGDKDYSGSYTMPKTIYPISTIVEALRTGSYIQVQISLYDDGIANSATGTENLFLGSPIYRDMYLVAHFEPELKSLVKAIIAPHLERNTVLQGLDAYLGVDLPEPANGAQIGHNGFWIFTP